MTAKKICGAVRVYKGKEYVCHRKPGHTRWWHQNEEGNFRWKPVTKSTEVEMTAKEAKEKYLQVHPSAKLVGPSGDGAHIDVDGKWMGFGNLPENAWIDALRRIQNA
jgi:hypothetical protein